MTEVNLPNKYHTLRQRAINMRAKGNRLMEQAVAQESATRVAGETSALSGKMMKARNLWDEAGSCDRRATAVAKEYLEHRRKAHD